LDDLTCPACTAPGLLALPEGSFRCAYCGTLLQVQSVTCPACGWENVQGAEDCRNCGEPLSVVARVLTRQGAVGPPFWLGRVRDRADELKRREAWASEQRMEQLREIDRRRMQDDARALARQRAADRQIVLVLGLALGVLGVIVVTLVLLRFGGG
jgi:hypothetical protein